MARRRAQSGKADASRVPRVDHRRLGRSSTTRRPTASFTLDTYVHLLDNDLGEPLPFTRAF
jgi:hypothetical protein